MTQQERSWADVERDEIIEVEAIFKGFHRGTPRNSNTVFVSVEIPEWSTQYDVHIYNVTPEQVAEITEIGKSGRPFSLALARGGIATDRDGYQREEINWPTDYYWSYVSAVAIGQEHPEDAQPVAPPLAAPPPVTKGRIAKPIRRERDEQQQLAPPSDLPPA